jgi:addiction module HigA family antidote
MTHMHNPPHPGAVLVECLDGLDDLAITQFAEGVHLTRATLSQIIDGHAPITFDLAVRLENALGTSREMWIGMQSAYDFWITEGERCACSRI